MKWWQNAVIYQIYPRSFKDSNGDGIGDIPGIISRLDYLKELGIDAIWLSPVYESPNDDNGYDISDYQAIHPDFGTMADMDRLIEEAKSRGIRIVMDLVVNHTSDEHQWFVEGRKSKDNEYRDYYIWRDPVNGEAPNDLTSTFGGSAWEYDEKTAQYYLHLFSKKQPDLNWENEKVRQSVYDMMNFWLDKGIGGFRMDVIDLIGKKPDEGITGNGPKLHHYLQELHQETLLNRDVMTVGETWGATPETAMLYSDPLRQELSMVFQFEHMQLDEQPGGTKWDLKPLDLTELKRVLSKWQVELKDSGWNSLFWNNHDLPRIVSRFGNDTDYRVESAKLFAILLHLMKGTPYIYQGEEIGMTNRKIESIDEVDDIESINMYHERLSEGYRKDALIHAINVKGRDNARTPMHWDDSEQAGFTTGTPWLPVQSNYKHINVKESLDSEDSIFSMYKKLIQLRKDNPLVVWGDYELLLPDHPSIFAYTRSYQGNTWLVAANVSGQEERLELDEDRRVGKVIVSNYGKEEIDLEMAVLQPFEATVVEIA
ncbi:glucan 1,6-alpha-glucosidase [Alkalibacterium putridalgicola]|uniref:Alpha-glucosidase n=1 Tax=Alkalibacterium putridalgicola TaxID=426703 RepID=A0A1H7UF36_9LACT|nr:alpha-glucosidase [Alkalibacterium putridalgicola]GEK89585.1 alpha-glucosidase [Alkalibacterium putridalgicola]SEL95268.1 glucan 1,6-alpha-glucosidase [Alkalibacterium putridalgicola]